MKNLKDIILEKLKVSSKLEVIFDDIIPCEFSKGLFIDASHKLFRNACRNIYEYYDLENIYGDDLPSFYKAFTVADENSKCIGLFGDFESKDPKISLIIDNHNNNKRYSTMFSITNYNCLFLSLGKGDITKGVGVLKYIADELK